MRLYANRYREIRQLGRGGHSRVLLVEDTKTSIQCALKLLNIPLFGSAHQLIDAFRNEFKFLKSLSHPSVAKVYDAGCEEYEDQQTGEVRELYYITTEYIAGSDLFEASKNLNLLEKEELFIQVLRVLNYLHSFHPPIFHLDIKPTNFLVVNGAQAKQIKLIDFGFANFYDRNDHKTVAGSAPYLAPEVIQGRPPDGRTDLYSLGATYYLIMTGRPLFSANSPAEYHTKHMHEKPIPPAQYVSDLPEYWNNLILKLLEKEPEKRFQSPTEIIEAINFSSEKYYDVETQSTLVGFIPNSGPLIGRKNEFEKFINCFNHRINQTGTNILPYLIIQGAEGTGKTRFIDEAKNTAQRYFIATLSWKEFMTYEDIEAIPTPCLVIEDDAKFDSYLLNYLTSFFKDRPILIVFTTKEQKISAEDGETIILRNFTPKQTANYMSVATGMDEMTPEQIASIHSITEGNPLYLAEFLRTAFGAGKLRDKHGAWDKQLLEDLMANFNAASFAEFIEKKIREKITEADLSNAEQEILAMMALYSKPTLEDISELSNAHHVDEVLQGLVTKEILVISPMSDYVFANPIYKKIFLITLAPAEKAKFCDRIAAYSEKNNAAYDQTLYFKGRGTSTQSADYLLELAEFQKEGHQYFQAVESLQEIFKKLAISGDIREKAQLMLATLYLEMGDYDQAQSQLEKLINELICENNNIERLVQSQELLAVTHVRKVNYQAAEQIYQMAIQQLTNHGDLLYLKVNLLNRKAQMALELGQLKNAESLFLEARALWLNDLDQADKIKAMRSDIDLYYFDQKDFQKAIYYLNERIMALKDHHHLDLYPIYIFRLARCYRELGQSKQAETLLKLSLENFKTQPAEHWLYRVYNELGTLYQHTKKYEQALKNFQHAFQLARRTETDARKLNLIIYNIGLMNLKLGIFEEAKKYFEFAIKNFQSIPAELNTEAIQCLFLTHLGLVSIFSKENEFESAKTNLNAAEDFYNQHEVLSKYQEHLLKAKSQVYPQK